jgi:hypothetical protein
MMIFATVAISIVIVLGFGLGVFFIVGAIKHWKILFDPPDADYVPSFWITRSLFGEKYLFVGYLFGGILCVCLAVFGAIKVIHDLVFGI